MPDAPVMRFGGKDVVLAIEGRQEVVRRFTGECRRLVAQADVDGLSVRALADAIERLAQTHGFVASHTGTDSNSINFAARPATTPTS